MTKTAHAVDPLPLNVSGEHGTKPVPPETPRLMAKINPALSQQIYIAAQKLRKPNVDYHNEPDRIGR